MKRNTMILMGTVVLALLVYTQLRTPIHPLVQAQSRGSSATPAQRNELLRMLKADASDTAIRSWARQNKLQIVSLKGNDYQVIPEPGPVPKDQPQEVGACDKSKCPTATGGYVVKNTLGKNVGLQTMTCTAGSCRWVYNPELKSNTRICENWKCVADGPPQKY